MWVRTGLWVLPAVSRHLHIAEASEAEVALCRSSSESGGSGGGASTWLRLTLRGGGQITALVEVCSADGRPLSLRLCLAGEHELWSFSDWQQWQPGLWLAGAAVQSTGGDSPIVNEYASSAVQVLPAGSGGAASRCAQPATPLMPPDAEFLPGLPAEVPTWYTASGHRCRWGQHTSHAFRGRSRTPAAGQPSITHRHLPCPPTPPHPTQPGAPADQRPGSGLLHF